MLKRQATTNPDHIFGKCPTSVDLAAVFHKEKPRKRRYSQVGWPAHHLPAATAVRGEWAMACEPIFAAHVVWYVGRGPAAARGGGGVPRCEHA